MKYRIAIAAMAMCSLAAPVLAWEHTTDFRGLEIFDYEAGGIDMQIICDPEGAFIPPIFSATISLDGVDYEGELILRSSAGTFTAQAMNGGVSGKDEASWASLISALRSSAQIELDADDQTFKLDTEAPFPVTCGAEI